MTMTAIAAMYLEQLVEQLVGQLVEQLLVCAIVRSEAIAGSASNTFIFSGLLRKNEDNNRLCAVKRRKRSRSSSGSESCAMVM